MVCWPSYKHLTDRTGQDVKTVEAGLRRLREAGFITDTRERKGSTGQVVVYELKTPVIGAVDTDGKTPVFPVKTPVFPMKDPQISRLRPPFLGDGTSKEPVIRTSKEKERDPRLSALAPELLADYMKVRKAKKAGEFTRTAIDGMEREAMKAGISFGDAVRACAEFGWQGFNAGWYEQRVAKQSGSSETAYQRTMREKWEVATGRNKHTEVINGDAKLLG